ncbi:MAG: multidrug ABC transporter substrate-binding protein, partial [Gemmatimonadetes bacterium]|nr:multidrug ABC transporter substrate-binding protein [Gemmatimonadota bacterium]NIS01268.1 multidrug ABC transporter substrate-binding protein [Gemmatimonadota bacterium]NIT67014.1 multidrug ABC transporter substrate-binding protein [Gemmatimonadota bacterium]NIU51637.1 multidrug ABC transporter substrate-binding protein [Gemmatimonadota bacterium]NIV23808.1 multidrug ABC transporter substrate-binding protein [Gemmatimonadota bacterium]
IESLGTNLLSIRPGQSFRRGVASADRVSLTTDDALALRRDAHAITAIIPEISSNAQIEYVNKNINVSVIGTSPAYV